MATVDFLAEPPAEPVPETGAKKKKLTKEERTERKKQRKLLKQQKELEQQRQQFRDHLARELKYVDLTYKRAAADWEAMCAAIKIYDLRNEVTEIWQGLNRALDNKNHTISRILGELDIAEEQYRRNFSNHADILEYLIKLFKLFVNFTRDAYEQDAAALIAEFEVDIAEQNEIHVARKTYYENVLHATNLMTANLLHKMETNFSMQVHEMSGTHIAKRVQFQEATIQKMQRIYEHMNTIIAELQCDALNPKREQRYNGYVERQEQATKEMKQFEETSKHLQDIITAKQSRLTDSESGSNMEVVKLRGERSYFVEQYWQLKQRHKEAQRGHGDLLRCLAYASKKAITELEKIEKYGKLILGVVACCRKLQTEKEKVIPWTEECENITMDNVKPADDSADNVVEQLRPMHFFWNLVGQAETHCMCLREEKQVLEKENENLRQILRSYCEMQAYNKIICSLQISAYPTSSIPIQEASHMPQLKK